MILFKVSLILLFINLNLINCDTFSNVINKKVERIIDISNQLVTITCRIVIENTGNSPLNSYFITFDENHRSHLSYLEATLNKADKTQHSLSITKSTNDNLNDYWQINFDKEYEIAPGSISNLIEVEAVFTHLLEPYPTQITQAEKQLVLYNSNHYFLSPYLTKTQTTKVKLPSSGSLESYSKLNPSSTLDHAINYGPYDNIQPHTVSKMKVHVENNSPFLTVVKLDRKLELSHWAGVISVEESIDIRHDGAILKGSFSRYEFQRENNNGISAVRGFKTKLPANAFDIYYRDEIGNISTSQLKGTHNHIIANLKPRFPLFGGWKTHYILGYYVPAKNYLRNEGSQFLLKIPFIDHIFDNSVIDEALVSIILPEGASDIKLKLPFSIMRKKDKVFKTYLDTVGRTVVVLSKNNLVEQHIQDFELEYKFNKLYMLQEPFLIVFTLFLICLVVIIYSRLDFSLTKNPVKESNLKVSGLVETILKHHSKRATAYGLYDQASFKCKSNKDIGSYHATIKQLNQDLKHETTSINDLISKMKSEIVSNDIIEKVNELQKLDKALKEQLQQQSVLIEKLVSNKINKQLYMDTESNLTKRKEEIAEKMLAITNIL